VRPRDFRASRPNAIAHAASIKVSCDGNLVAFGGEADIAQTDPHFAF
jgi:hypothetical protein